jgi:hypothetical protein
MAMIEKIDTLMIVMREPGIVPVPKQALWTWRQTQEV